MIPSCPHPAANPLVIRELRNVAQTVAYFIGDSFSNNLQVLQVTRDGKSEIPFNQCGDLCLRELLLQKVYAEIANMHVYALLHYLKEQGPFTAQFFTGYKYDPLSWQMSVTYDGALFELHVASQIFDADYRLVEIPYEDCLLERFETEGSNSVLDHLQRIKHALFMQMLQLQIPLMQADSPPVECNVPAVTQYLGDQNPYSKEYSIPQISLCDSIFSEKDAMEALQYYLSWRCSKVVLYYQTADGEQCEEVVCNTGNVSSQDTRRCLYMYTKDVLYYMYQYEQCMLRIYIGMENVIAVDISAQSDGDGAYDYNVMYLTSPTLSTMTKSEIKQYFRTHIGDYLHVEHDMQDRLILCMKDVITKMPSITDVDSVAPLTETDSP